MSIDEKTKQNVRDLIEGHARLGYYKLADDGKTPIPVKDVLEWARFFEDKEKRVVKQDHFGNVMVSTVFLGMDHGFSLNPGPGYRPVLWETMVFNGSEGGWQARARSLDEALIQHDQAVAVVKRSQRLWFRVASHILAAARRLWLVASGRK